MSLKVTVDVNGHVIGEITVTRQSSLHSPRDIHDYEWQAWYYPIGESGYPSTKRKYAHGVIQHRYNEGWGGLVHKLTDKFYTGYLGD